MQNGSGAKFALPWQATGLWWSCHLENDSWQRRPASITFRYSFLFANLLFSGCNAVKAQGNVARICLVIAQTSFEEEMLHAARGRQL